MSNFLISFLVAVSAGAWVFSKMTRQTGGDKKTSLLVAVIAGVLALIVVLVTLNSFFSD